MTRAALALALVFVLSVPAFAERSPNVVLILGDDQHWGDYGFMGHDVIQTPNIDRLAQESRTYTRGYVPVSLCRPSLVSMLTGLQPHQHRITGNDPVNKTRERHEKVIALLDEVPTLPTMLAERGYLSHQSGKWWEGNYARGGFTHGMTHGDPERRGRHGDVGLKIGREGMGPVVDFIDHAQAEEKPFFVWYAPFLPHTPHNPPERLLRKYRAEGRPLAVARYYAMIEWLDETVGELLGHIDDQGLAEDTVVLFVCDNGWIQRHAQLPLPQAWSQPYGPRSKRSPYDGGIRTPMLVRWPGTVEPGLDDETLVSTLDLAPTILDIAGLEPTEQMTGVNLLDEEAVDSREAIFGAIFEHDIPDPLGKAAAGLRHRWVIKGHHKLIYP
ncbi:MAG: sulfatase, partial [Phycisphaeraceae bacterium]